MADRKLVQLSRRLKAAQIRFRSLEKRLDVIDRKRASLKSRANTIINILYSREGQKATLRRQKSLERRFIQANREAERLKKVEDKIYQQLKPLEEKISVLKDNMRKVRAGKKLNPRYLITATRKRIEKDVDLGVLQDDTAKKALSRAKGIYKGKSFTNMKARKRNLSPAQIRARKKFAAMAKARNKAAKAKRRNPNATQTLKKAGSAAKRAVQSTLDAGSKLLKAGAKVLNPTKRIKYRNSYIDLVIRGTAKKTRDGWKVGRKTVAQGRGTAKLSSGYYLDKATGAVYAKRQRNAARKGMRKLYGAAKRVDPGGRKKVLRKAARVGKRLGVKSVPGWERNPSAEATRQKFAGSVTGERDLFYPIGTPNEKLAKLGKLVSIKTEKGTIKPLAGEAWLVADSRGRLHIGSTKQAPLIDGPKRCFGKVSQIEYQDVKKHLGIGKQTIFWHRVGEENGVKPKLYADGKGGLVFKGGDYRLTTRGLEN